MDKDRQRTQAGAIPVNARFYTSTTSTASRQTRLRPAALARYTALSAAW